MRPVDDRARLDHILEAARKAFKFTKGLTRSDLDSNEMLVLALTRLLEIIGEAASQMTPETRNRLTTVPWKKMMGMRNILIHGYYQVNLDILWQTIVNDLPALVTELEKIIDKADQQ